MSVLDSATRSLIAAQLAAGATTADIAATLGCNRSNISHIAARPVTRALIEQYQQTISDAVMQHVQSSTIDLVSQYQQSITTLNGVPVSQREAIKIEHAGKIARGMLQSIGVLPSHAPSVMIQQIYNQVNVNLSPAVTEVLASVITPRPPSQEPDPEED